MSGYKRATVTISEEEYRRLHQADIKRRFREHDKNTIPSRQVAGLTNSLKEMEGRQRQLEQALRDLDLDSGWAGVEMMEGFLDQNARQYENLATIVEEAISDANVSLDFLSQRFTEQMQREREQYHYHLQSLSQRLNAYDQREQSKAEAARQWLRQSVAFADFIEEQSDHERFLPGELSGILSSLSFAQSNLAQGLFESSMQTSQQAFLRLSELYFELEQRIVEWQTEYERAHRALSQFIAELEMNAQVNALGLEGEELTEQVDLDFWSNAKYQELLGQCQQLLRLLTQEQRSISTEDLKNTNHNLLPIVVERFESIIYEARLNALNSQLRMNIAERALQALETQGFKLHAAGYANQDMRAAFTANLENFDGSRVMIEVLPAETTRQELTNELVVITNHPYLKTEHEARLQWQELCHSLNQFDLRVGRPEIRAIPPVIPDPVEPRSARNEPLIRSQRQHNV